MSSSFAHDGGVPLNDADTPDGSLDEQLAAEIADHLAAAAGELVRRGESQDQAEQLALAKFGDVSRVKRQCWWIHHGEEFMFRTAGIALLSLLTIGVVVLGVGGWQLQQNLSARTEELSAQIASLGATQKALLDQQKPPEISGMIYRGDHSKPVANAEVQVFRFAEEPITNSIETGVVARRVRTDERGHFESGILPPGDYCVIAPLVDPAGQLMEEEMLFQQVQSAPLFLSVGGGKGHVELNVVAPARLRLNAVDVPDSVDLAGDRIRIGVEIDLLMDDDISYSQPLSPSDEAPRDGWPLPLHLNRLNAGVELKGATLPRDWWLPAREYTVVVRLAFWPPENSGHAANFPVRKYTHTIVDLAKNASATLTLRLPNEPLQQRFEKDAEQWIATKQQAQVTPSGEIDEETWASALRQITDGLELKLDVTMENGAVSQGKSP